MMIDNKSEEAVVDQTAIDTESDVSMDILSARDAAVEDKSKSKDDLDDAPANAPVEENLKAEEPDASTDGKPAAQEVKQTDADNTDQADDSGEDKADDSLMNDLLDVEPEEKFDLETMKKRYSDSTRHITALTDKIRSVEEVLAAAGRQIVNTKEGPKLVAMDDTPEIKLVAPDKVFESLSESEKELFMDDPQRAAKLVAERVTKQIADSFAPVQASSKDVVLSPAEMDKVYEDFIATKLSDGKTARFQDADHPEVRDLMQKAHQSNTPAMQKFKELASKDKDVNYIMLEYLYNKAFRARHAKLSVLAAKQKAAETIKQNIGKEPSVTTKGAGQSVKGQQVSKSSANSIESRIFASIDQF